MDGDNPSRHVTAIAGRRAQTLSSIVLAAVEEMILTGALKPGERINEQALADQLGVSRGPVREAARALEKIGLVRAVTNHGVFVRELSPEEAAELYDVRGIIFGFLCGVVAKSAGRQQTDQLYALICDMDNASDADDYEAYYKSNIRFHELIVEYANHARAQEIYRQVVKEVTLIRKRTLHNHDNMHSSNSEHRAIFGAIVAGDSRAAREAGEAHVTLAYQRWRDLMVPSEDESASPQG